MTKEGKKKLHKVATPAAQELKTVSFQLESCYEWDTRKMKLRKGDNPRIKATMEDEVLLCNAGSADTLELEDTNMYQTDSRDRAADRDAVIDRSNGCTALAALAATSTSSLLGMEGWNPGTGSQCWCQSHRAFSSQDPALLDLCA